KSSSTGGHRVENSRTNGDGAKNTEGSAAGEKKDDKKGLEKDVVPTISEGKIQPPVTAAASTSETAIDGDSKGSSTAATALRSDDDTEGNPAKNGLRQPSSERTAEHSTTPDSEDASDSAEKAASQNAGIPTTKAIATAKTNDTASHGDSDGITAVSHTTSPLLLLLLFVVCCCCGGGRVRVRERESHAPPAHTLVLLSVCVCPLAWTLALASPHEAYTIMCPLYICMHTHAGPLVLSFAPHAPLPSCLAAWAEHRNCFCLVFIALSGRPLSLSLCVCFALREQ
ncbi:mucin-associated surface protein (MASP), partial [Trypanosoma cruzi]